MKKLPRLLAVLPLLPLLPLLLPAAGCANRINRADYRTEYHYFYAAYAPQIEQAARIHEDTMVTLGKLYAQGLLSKGQLEVGRGIGRRAEISIKTARDSLASYLKGRSSRAAVLETLIKVQQNLLELVGLVDSKRVGEVGGQLP